MSDQNYYMNVHGSMLKEASSSMANSMAFEMDFLSGVAGSNEGNHGLNS